MRWRETHAVVDDMLVARVVVDVYCDAAKSGYFGGELGEAGIVLSVEGRALDGMGLGRRKL